MPPPDPLLRRRDLSFSVPKEIPFHNIPIPRRAHNHRVLRVPTAVSDRRFMVLEGRDLSSSHHIIDINTGIMGSSVDILLTSAMYWGEVAPNKSTQHRMAFICCHWQIKRVFRIPSPGWVVHPSVIPFEIPKASTTDIRAHFPDIPKFDRLIFAIWYEITTITTAINERNAFKVSH